MFRIPRSPLRYTYIFHAWPRTDTDAPVRTARRAKRRENFSKFLAPCLPTFLKVERAAASLEGRTTLQALTPSLDMRGAASVVGSEILGGWECAEGEGES